MEEVPEEILVRIFAQLKLPTLSALGIQQKRFLEYKLAYDQMTIDENRMNLKTLASLTQCSKRFRRIARPLLYSVFPGAMVVASTKFLSALLDNSETSRPSLDLRHLLLDFVLFSEHGFIYGNGHGAWFKSIQRDPICRRLMAEMSKDIKVDLCTESFGVALLLALCTNVTTIDLSLWHIWNNESLVQLLNTLLRVQHVDGLPRPLHQLRGLIIRCNAGYPNTLSLQTTLRKDARVVEMILRQPTLDTLTIDGASHLDLDCLTLTPQLRKLCFWSTTDLRIGWLEYALQNCPKLVELVVDWTKDKMTFKLLQEKINYARLGTVVCEHAKAMEHLVLDARSVLSSDHEPGSTLNLRNHTSLKEITLDSRAFWSALPKEEQTQTRTFLHDVLPASLQRLTILICLKAFNEVQYMTLIVPDILSLVLEAPSTLQSIHLEVDLETQGSNECYGFENDADLLRVAGWNVSMGPSDTKIKDPYDLSVYAEQCIQVAIKLERVGIDDLSAEQRAAWTHETNQRRHAQQDQFSDCTANFVQQRGWHAQQAQFPDYTCTIEGGFTMEWQSQ